MNRITRDLIESILLLVAALAILAVCHLWKLKLQEQLPDRYFESERLSLIPRSVSADHSPA